MEFITARELRLNPKEVWKRLRKGKIGVITLNGKPRFIIYAIDPSELEEFIYLFNQLRARSSSEPAVPQSKANAVKK